MFSADPPHLFTPLTIRSVTIPNRITVSPMCEYSSDDGFANDWHLVHLGSRAVGGAGLVMAEATAVTPEGRITNGDLGIWKKAHIEPLRRIANFVKSQGSIPGIQLAHAGRKGSSELPWDGGHAIAPSQPGGWLPVAPSPIPFVPGNPVPHTLTIAGIARLVDAFATAAHHALQAGFEVVEIHAAHGYLINEFLSPLSNQRSDEYGGSFDSRVRFLLEVISAVRGVIGPDVPLFLRISATDWVDGGWTIDDSVELARRVVPLGVDLIDASSGGVAAKVKIPVAPGYQVEFAHRIRKETGALTAAVGLITTADQANAIIREHRADLVFLAREFLRNPYFPLEAARRLDASIEVPKQYLRAFPHSTRRGWPVH